MRILVVEDDPRTRTLLTKGLTESGHECAQAAHGEEALALMAEGEERFDLVLLDVMMPVCDGWEVLARLRGERQRTPVVMLTARHEVHERVQGLKLGADDYLIKPFAWSELLARIEAVGRRTQSALRVGDLVIDLEQHVVRCGKLRIELSPREFALLACLAREPGRVVTRKQLLTAVWGIDFDPGTNVVDVAVSRLRRRLTSARGVAIEAEPGLGYALHAVRKASAGGA
jgi:two-component system, OmpR family, copper resistance phosphate regulon response regulator CusR